MRLKLWPISPFLAMGGGVYLMFRQTPILWFLFDASFLISGLLFVRSFAPWQKMSISYRKREYLWSILFAQLGFLVVALPQVFIEWDRQKTSLGLPMEKITEIEFLLVEDPSPLKGMLWIAEAHLLKTASYEFEAGARGRITILGKSGVMSEGNGIGFGCVIRSSGRWGRNSDQDSLLWTIQTMEFRQWIFQPLAWRQYLLDRINCKLEMTSRDTYTFLSALVLGRRVDTGSRTMRNFRDAGCMHLLALSGFHVGLIAVAIRRLSKRFLGIHGSSAVSLLFVVFYLLLVGFTPSLVRATLMYVLWSINSIRGYKTPSINYLCMAFVIQMTIFPHDIHSLSFRLSYAALAGIIIGGLKMNALFSRYLPPQMAAILGIGLGAQAGTMPLVIASFKVWRPIALLSAVILTPFVAFAMAGGVLLSLLPIGARLTSRMVLLLECSVHCMTSIAGIFARVSPIRMNMPIAWIFLATGIILPHIWKTDVQSLEPRLPRLHPYISSQ